jgi:hypothetical protein
MENDSAHFEVEYRVGATSGTVCRNGKPMLLHEEESSAPSFRISGRGASACTAETR